MNTMKNSAYALLLFFYGTWLILVESTPAHMVATQPSVVIAWNKVAMALITLSKLACGFIHSPPAS